MIIDEDKVAQILEHPLSHYTTTEGDETPGHDHKRTQDRQRCARRQVMTTEYSRTICKSAERHQKPSDSRRKTSEENQYAEAYGQILAPAPKVTLS